MGKDGSILQYVLEEKKAWTQGNVRNPSAKVVLERKGINPNLYCISIENEGQDLKNHTLEQFRSLIELIKDIAKRHNIVMDRQHILGHFEIDSVNRPYCPSTDHSILDEIVTLCNIKEETVNIPKRLLDELKKY